MRQSVISSSNINSIIQQSTSNNEMEHFNYNNDYKADEDVSNDEEVVNDSNSYDGWNQEYHK